MNFEILENKLKYKFNNKELLKLALTHKSYLNNTVENNEKLEYLGDSILEFVISFYLYENYKNLTEGEMTKVRATVVCEESLKNFAIKNDFSDFLFLSKSERKNGKNISDAILADSVEAVIAAIYLDSDMDNITKFIIDNLKEEILFASQNVGIKDYKTVLQEKLQENGDVEIKYLVINEEGPDHDKIFTVKLMLNGNEISIGKGKSKKAAEMTAAKEALKNL